MATLSSDSDNLDGGLQFTAPGQSFRVRRHDTVGSQSSCGIVDPSFGNEVVINQGRITGAEAGVAFRGDGDELFNGALGEISSGGARGHGVTLEGGDAIIANRGTISGESSGIYNDGDGTAIWNGGVISGVESVFQGASTQIYNHGMISENGVSCFYQNEYIRNRGTIEGGISGKLNATVSINNSGLIEGGIGLLDGNNKVKNTGEIDGGVLFGESVQSVGGTNVYDGRGGTVNAAIIGGSGTEKIYAGDDGETMFGGGGHDYLHGGAGADTFGFESYQPGDADRIFGFQVSQDTVQLNHNDFAQLEAGKMPDFSNASSATSATDYLFYNGRTGGLYYDPDGSGSGAASLVADLGKDLHLACSNFKVV